MMPGYAVMPPGQPAFQPSQQRWTPPSQPTAVLPPPPPTALSMPPPPAVAAGRPQPKFRGVAADPTPPPAPVRIAMPSPEALGIKLGSAADKTAPAAVDWNQVHARLERLGIVRYEHGRLPQGGFRVVLAVQTRQVEATGATEGAAVMLALDRAEGLVAAR